MEIQYWRDALQSALDDSGMPDALTPQQLDRAAESLAAQVQHLQARSNDQ